MADVTVYEKEVDGQTVNFRERTTEKVIANPSAEVSEQLEKLQVGETVYSAGMTTEERNKLAKALVTPVSAPSATELVAVGTNGTQTMLEIGQGLRVSAGILEASGGNYVLELTGESGTLTDEQYQAVVDNFPNVVVTDGTYQMRSILHDTELGYMFNSSAISDGETNTIDVANNICIINNKNYTFTSTYTQIPTSSGGLTKTKVTLAELQSMLTTENVGTLVSVNIKQTPTLSGEEGLIFLALAQGGAFDRVLTISNYLDDTIPNTISFTQFFHTGVGSFNLIFRILQNKAQFSLLDIQNSNTTDFSPLVTDNYFDFYIYK